MRVFPNVEVLLVGGNEELDEKLTPAFDARGWRLMDVQWEPATANLVQRQTADLLLLAIHRRATNAFGVARWVRSFSDLPVIFLSRTRDESLMCEALDAGGDDFVSEPFSTNELVARLEVKLERARRSRDEVVVNREWADQSRSLRCDPEGRYVSRDGVRTRLTPTEFRLLMLFARHPGRVLSYTFVVETIWGGRHTAATELVRAYVHKLRLKLGEPQGEPPYITTIPGVGYIFNGVASLTPDGTGHSV